MLHHPLTSVEFDTVKSGTGSRRLTKAKDALSSNLPLALVSARTTATPSAPIRTVNREMASQNTMAEGSATGLGGVVVRVGVGLAASSLGRSPNTPDPATAATTTRVLDFVATFAIPWMGDVILGLSETASYSNCTVPPESLELWHGLQKTGVAFHSEGTLPSQANYLVDLAVQHVDRTRK
mmetsp:Transcript_33350/g.100733  ORF Transcript_33350/g.100733 Transcript_33350/m.100733 type:complete len:181 (-) Transcript_33350:25-567(-)